jgi:hypothetical protein
MSKLKKEVDLEKLPNPKLHQIVSFIKSGIRIAACVAAVFGYFEAGFSGLLLAELVGVYEEMV